MDGYKTRKIYKTSFKVKRCSTTLWSRLYTHLLKIFWLLFRKLTPSRLVGCTQVDSSVRKIVKPNLMKRIHQALTNLGENKQSLQLLPPRYCHQTNSKMLTSSLSVKLGKIWHRGKESHPNKAGFHLRSKKPFSGKGWICTKFKAILALQVN